MKETITIRLEPEQIKRVKEKAKREDRSISAVIRIIIKKFFKAKANE